MTEVMVTLPYPPAGLSPNSRLHWREKAKLTAQYREDCGWAAREAWENIGWAVSGSAVVMADFTTRYDKRPLTPPVEADVTFYVPDRRKRDQDNLLAMLKPAWDGMVDAGLLVGDDSRVFSVASVFVACVDVEQSKPRVVVTLRGGE